MSVDHNALVEHWFGEDRLLNLGYLAARTERYLHQSWERPVRHNRKIERTALWYAVHLESVCERVSDDPDLQPRILPLPPSDATPPEVRYEFEAAVRAIPPLFPLDRQEIKQILTPTWESVDEWVGPAEERHAPLLERWHAWLWAEEGSEQAHPQGDHGESSVLAIAASRIAEHVPTILSWYRGGEPN